MVHRRRGVRQKLCIRRRRIFRPRATRCALLQAHLFRWSVYQLEHRDHHQRGEQEPEQRRHEDEGHRLQHARPDQRRGAGLGQRGADDAADQRVRAARRDAVPPGDHVPEHRPDQRTEHHPGGDHVLVDDALADRVRNVERHQPIGGKVAERGVRYLATRFSAKEAFSKAIGLGMRMPMTWRSMQVLNAPSGKPIVVTSGALTEFMRQHGLSAHVTITDEVDAKSNCDDQ